ncbi:MAG: hypothetical protein HKN23_20945 [Verrucomicrobiales bacterium]|nr:hypothetical protein [Verrucomicrobiales bacterium]
MRFRLSLAVFGFLSLTGFAQQKSHLELDSSWGSFVEDDFPFFSQTLDARELGDDWPKDNLTPRGLILKLGHGYFACFDTDLLRIALIWKENKDGEYLTMDGMGPGSYRLPNRKASAGQKSLPKPIGKPVAATGLFPGVFPEGLPGKLTDPREKSVDPEELGLGPIPDSIGKFRRITFPGKYAGVSYLAGETKVWDSLSATPEGVVRSISVDPGETSVAIAIGKTDDEVFVSEGSQIKERDGFRFLIVPPRTENTWIGIGYGRELAEDWAETFAARNKPTKLTRWGEKLTTKKVGEFSENSFLSEEVGLPLNNPWKRNVRLSAFDFFSDGRAAFVTFDGDVWIVSGLAGDLSKVTWERFSSGFHEPIALEIVDDEIYVFDRNGIWIVERSEGSGKSESYVHRIFCNLVSQTAETREFANDMWEKPGGGFYIAKGGQVSTTRGKHNGTVVEIAPDGKSIEVIATGFRMPYIGVDPKTGLITASDQQGHWKPATPLHVVWKGEYYGFQPAFFKDKAKHPASIDQPEIHIPHFVNQSGASQIWTRKPANLGPLNDSLIHVGYNRPEIFKVYFDSENNPTQGAVVSIMHRFPSGIMKPRIHPIDGSLWLTGFKIWGTAADQISGLYRVTWTGEETWIPADVRSSEKGVLLSFHQPVDEAVATNLASYTVDRWNYKQTHNYGSGNYKLDGKPGQETMPVASAMLSKDKKSVFVGLPDMKPVHSIRVTYKVPNSKAETPTVASAFFTVYELQSLDLKAHGFATNDVDLTLKAGAADAMREPEPSIEIGKATATKYGCLVCHSVDGNKVPAALAAAQNAGQQVAVGPGWKGLWGSKREFTDGVVLKNVDEVYLRESIVDPARNVQKGFETEKTGVGMPSYLGVLKDYEIDSIILYIKSLAK